MTIDKQIQEAETRIHEMTDRSEHRDMWMLDLCELLLKINKALNEEVKKLKGEKRVRTGKNK